ncbi:hypothetical protein LIA77_00038 [Sarocladium implicatum]|nr:hypothetical protein LIA77_00038 [Sarocladium implicatum]
MRSTGLLLGFAAAVSFGAAVPAPSNVVIADAPNHAHLPTGEIGWEGVVVKGEPPVEIWGATFEDIETKIREKYNKEFSIYTKEENKIIATSENKALKARSKLESRSRNINCDARYGLAQSIYIEAGKDNLRRINGNSCKAKARTCIRTQCTYTSGIGICNDNTWAIDIPCTTIADMAHDIGTRCAWMDAPHCDPQGNCAVSPYNMWERGQAFSPGLSWNVIVGDCTFFGNGERPVKS